MRIFTKRALSLLMALVLCAGMLTGITFPASASTVDYVYGTPAELTKYSNVIYNWGTRGTEATSLSPNAVTFYTDKDAAYSELSQLSGSSSTSSVPSSALYQALNQLVTNAQTVTTSYDDTRYLYRFTDCQGSALTENRISSFYSGALIGPEWDGGSTWNREHTWPNSKGDANGQGENDIMMLRPAAVSENGSRSNRAYGESTGYYFPNTESGGTVDSPGTCDVRGDVARIMLYVYTRWGTEKMWGTDGVIESKEVLLKWMEEDPVDTWEMGRNDSVQSITGTRNIYVDYPELAFCLFNEEVPATMQTPSGGEDVAPAYTVTAVSNNGSYGTVSLNENVITATPATGYHVAGYTVTNGQATVSRNGNVFTVTPESDCTVQINFEADPVEPADVVKIMAHNVYFDEYLQIMYAVYIPEGETVQQIVLSDGNREFRAVPFVDEEGNPVTPTVGGKVCTAYVADNGVSLQNIDTVVTAKVYVDGDVAVTDTYSVLQYLHKRLTIDDLTSKVAEKAMYERLLYAAEKVQTVINGSVTLYDTSYVYVTDGTIDGIRADGMVEVGAALEYVTSDLIPGENQEIVWSVAKHTQGSTGAPATMTTEQVRAMVVEKNVNLILSAALQDTDAPAQTWTKVTDASILAAGDQIVIVADASDVALSTTQNTNNRGQATVVKEGNTVTFGNDVQILTLEAGAVSGTFALNTGSGYLYASSSSANQLKTQAEMSENASWLITIDGGVASIVAQGSSTRNVMQHNSTSSLFACYASASQKALAIYKLSGGAVVEPDPTEPTEPSVEPTEPEVTEPEVTEPVVTEPTTVEVSIIGNTGALASGNGSISWTSADGDVTFTNTKGGTAIRTSDADHYRAYSGSGITISANGKISQIVITCTSGSYATVMETSLKNSGYTVSVSGSVVTVTVSDAESITFTASAQTRLNKITVTYQK